MGEPEISRFKREGCNHTKHDLAFSKWEILIGPSDWKNYSLGKEGTERYRIQNLPISCSCPGLYELGIAASHTGFGRKIRSADPNSIVVVYLGQADNVRTRLQHYGRAGSHLDDIDSYILSNDGAPHIDTTPCPWRGPGLFREIFHRGFPIVFRWAPMTSKNEAVRTETQLLRDFDYAWNKDRNGSRRPNDILLKLDRCILSPTALSSIVGAFQHLKWKALGEKREGIAVNTSKPSKEIESNSDDPNHDVGSRIFKFGSARPRLITGKLSVNEDQHACGVALGNGSVCRNRPVEGRMRCREHKGKRVNSSAVERKGVVINTSKPLKETGSDSNDLNHDFGSHLFKSGRLRPQLIIEKSSIDGDHNVCGVTLGDGSVCRTRPVEGRKRCSEHKGKRVNDLVVERHSLATNGGLAINGNLFVCGVGLGDGSFCTETPVRGRKRCEQHKGLRVNGLGVERQSLGINGGLAINGNLCVCGVGLGDGSFCTKTPARGRKRCEQHKGMRVSA